MESMVKEGCIGAESDRDVVMLHKEEVQTEGGWWCMMTESIPNVGWYILSLQQNCLGVGPSQ